MQAIELKTEFANFMAYQIILCRLKKQKQNQENHEMNKFESDCKR